MDKKGIAILGGSFNPIHIGHLRLAIDIRELFSNIIDEVQLVPNNIAPHKNKNNFLPFSMRAMMVELAIKPLMGLSCNRLEGERKGPSYTFDTLQFYNEQYVNQDIYFILGSADYKNILSWYKGNDIAKLCNFIVVPRLNEKQNFLDMTCKIWPNSKEVDFLLKDSQIYGHSILLPSGKFSHFLILPELCVSASEIRLRWLSKKSINYLVPDVVREFLLSNEDIVKKYWIEE